MKRLLLSLGALAVLFAALWSGYWIYAARQVREEIVAWAEARRAEGLTLVWDRLDVGGYPLAFRVRADRLLVSDARGGPPWELRVPELIGTAPAWSLRRWSLSGAQGLTARLAPSDVRPAVIARVADVEGSVEPGEEGTQVEAAFTALAVEGPAPLRAERAVATVFVPRRAPATHTELFARASLGLEELRLPEPVGPFGTLVQHVELTAAVKGAIEGGPRRAALARWRDDGGVVEVEALRLSWDRLAASAQGTLALDGQMQPIGALTATLRGWAEVLDALGANGTMKSGDVVVARLALGLLAKPGSDGRSEITAPLTIQDSTLYIAKVKA
ncbi:MAG: DUF2125 domain-containing protein, partial [Rhodospirillales bacterium]|nr:DUF2125 domain-containing protein [Rhodospirillales bacterium]